MVNDTNLDPSPPVAKNSNGITKQLQSESWPFDTDHLYRIAFNFFRDNESKAFHPSYDQRNTLVAYSLQVKHGNFNPEKANPLGTLDFVGHDRRNAWIALKDVSPEDAKLNFIDLLNSLCPLFRPFVIAVKCDVEEKERKQIELEELEKRKQLEKEEAERLQMEEEEKRIEEQKRKEYEEQKRIIQELLNRQTFHQFSSYAKQQYPDNVELQEQLVSQLQEQHFQQYMEQLMEQSSEQQQQQQQLSNSNNILNNTDANGVSGDEPAENPVVEKLANDVENLQLAEPEITEDTFDEEETEDESEEDEESELKSTGHASMWTRKDVEVFKESIRAEGGQGVLKLGHGDLATIRVPTHDDGNCIFWEFATDHYDIGFGLFFEWTSTPDNHVSVHISESEDEDDDGETPIPENDVERGALAEPESKPVKLGENSAPISVIIPIYRRDSHEEVFAGSHKYPGKGVYLLKFDNSYSLWRSKTMYYRVYYTKEP